MTVLFDSGFLYVEDEKNGTWSAVMPKDAPETPEQMRHGLHLFSGENWDTKHDHGSLDGMSLEIGAINETTWKALPAESTVTQNPENCERIPSESPDANNLQYLPDLGQMYPAALKLSADTMATRFDMRGGSLAIRIAQGCWELRAKDKQPIPARSMVYGRDSVGYSASVNGKQVTVTLRSLEDGSVRKTIPIEPDANGTVTLRLAGERAGSSGAEVEQPMPDFRRMYSMFATTIGPDTQYIPHLKYKQRVEMLRPGTECGSARYTIR